MLKAQEKNAWAGFLKIRPPRSMSWALPRGECYVSQMKPSSPLKKLILSGALTKSGKLHRNQHLINLGQTLKTEARLQQSRRQLDKLLKRRPQA